MPEMILVFDVSGGYPARCRGWHPIPPASAGLTDLQEIERAGGGSIADVVVQRGDPEDFAGAPASAVTIASAGAPPVVNARAAAIVAAESALNAAKAGATDTLLEALLVIVTTPGVIDEGPLDAVQLALLARLRSEIVPNLSVSKDADLDDAVTTKTAQHAITDGLPKAVAAPV